MNQERKEKRFWKVYKVTNRITGESYIGCTILKLSQRKSLHYQKVKEGRNSNFYRALRSYAPSDFIWTIIEDNIKSEQRAEQREAYWIDYYDSIESGYNMDSGGWSEYSRIKPENQSVNPKEVNLDLIDRDHTRVVYCPELDETYKSIRACARELGIDRKAVKRVLDGKVTSYRGLTFVEVKR